MKKRKTFKALVAFTAMLLALVVVACGGDDGDTSADATGAEEGGEPIKIGHVLGATGWMRFYDLPQHETAKLAIEDINAEGGVLGRDLEIEQFDMKTDPPLGVSGVQKMIDEGADMLFAAGDLDTAGPSLQEAEGQGHVIFSAASDYRLGLFGNYVYGMGLASNVQGAAGAEWAYEEMGWRNAYALVDVTIAITKSAGQFFVQRFSELDGTDVVGTDTFQNDDASIASQITAIEQADPQPDFIYLSSFIPGSASAIKQIRDAGIDLPILCQISCGEGLSWLKGVPDLNNFFYTNMGYVYGPGDPNEQIWELAQRVKEETGKPMELSLDLAGYAMVQIIAWAIEEAGTTDQDAVNEALQSAENVDTILGPISFTEEFHMPYNQTVRIGEVKNGKQSLYGTWKPEEVNLTGENLPDL